MRTILSLLAALLGGCAVPYGAQFTPASAPPSGQALIYVLRASATTFANPMVSLNGKPLVKLGLDGYTKAYLPPGRYVVTTENDHAPAFEFTARAGTTNAIYLHTVQATGPTRLTGIVLGAAPMLMFGRTPPEHPYVWSYFENVAELPFVYNDLKTRKFLEPVPSAFTPLP